MNDVVVRNLMQEGENKIPQSSIFCVPLTVC